MSSRSEPATGVARRPLWRGALSRFRAAGRDARLLTAPKPPAAFDWRWYVESYTDLAAAGVVDEASAIRHWREHGRREGRRFAPRRPSRFDWLTYVDRFPEATRQAIRDRPADRPALVCPSIDSLFLRAWGDLVCWDDAGSDRVLQAWDPAVDYADVFLNGPYEEIRRRLASGRMPWAEDCARCLLLRIQPDGMGAPWDRRFVRMLRVEPSYLCSLDCPGCVPLSIRRQHSKAFQLDPDILDRIVADFVAGGLDVDAVDFQGHGEPLLNPRLWEMARRCRERLPGAWISVTTNAQGKFRPEMARSGFDEVICAIDGADAAGYAPYRVHGRFDLAWRFLTDFAEAGSRADRKVRVVWKYVIFEHNASTENLLVAQRMALDAGVSELVFVITRNGPAARNIREPADIPRLAPGPPMSFRFHEPSIDDLEGRLAEAGRLADAGEASDAAAMADSVRKNLERFFPRDGDRPERQTRLLAALDRLGAPAGHDGKSAGEDP